MTMWQELRKKYTNYTQTDIGKMVGKSKQYITLYETGKVKMPDKLRAMYLRFRNTEKDKIIADFLDKGVK